jgi:hypothetical protein
MSNPSIESLKLARDEAQAAVKRAEAERDIAEQRLYDAQVKACGLIGKIVRCRQVRIVVQSVKLNGSGEPSFVKGKLVNRDGSASHQDYGIWLCMPHEVSDFIREIA